MDLKMNDQMMELYLGMVVERHKIWLARQKNEPQPWTEDRVLRNRKFTNMFRVLDPGSQFVFDLDGDDPVDVIARLVFYRITNLPSTWHAIRNVHGRYPTAEDFLINSARLFQILDTHRQAGNRVFSGAYIIVPEPGTTNDKVAGALRLTKLFIQQKAEAFIGAKSQEERFAVLQSTPGLGKFLSMQILTDWDYLQPKKPDLSFIVAGPGAVRGSAWLHPTKKPTDVIYDLTFDWMDHPSVTLMGRSLTPMDVQNTLCEFSKYAKETIAPLKKTKYRPSHPGTQPIPVLPAWW
jgi:hypothetical protein